MTAHGHIECLTYINMYALYRYKADRVEGYYIMTICNIKKNTRGVKNTPFTTNSSNNTRPRRIWMPFESGYYYQGIPVHRPLYVFSTIKNNVGSYWKRR